PRLTVDRVHPTTGRHQQELRLWNRTASSDQQTTIRAQAWPRSAHTDICGTKVQGRSKFTTTPHLRAQA
ncbi:Hypothetical predicted protein, partial [Marmota monax]